MRWSSQHDHLRGDSLRLQACFSAGLRIVILVPVKRTSVPSVFISRCQLNSLLNSPFHGGVGDQEWWEPEQDLIPSSPEGVEDGCVCCARKRRLSVGREGVRTDAFLCLRSHVAPVSHEAVREFSLVLMELMGVRCGSVRAE